MLPCILIARTGTPKPDSRQKRTNVMARAHTILTVVSLSALPLTGCSLLEECDNYVSYDEVMDNWLGKDVESFERVFDVRPLETLKRPRGRTEYTYLTVDVRSDYMHSHCTTRMTADDETGVIDHWSYEGNYCVGYCND